MHGVFAWDKGRGERPMGWTVNGMAFVTRGSFWVVRRCVFFVSGSIEQNLRREATSFFLTFSSSPLMAPCTMQWNVSHMREPSTKPPGANRGFKPALAPSKASPLICFSLRFFWLLHCLWEFLHGNGFVTWWCRRWQWGFGSKVQTAWALGFLLLFCVCFRMDQNTPQSFRQFFCCLGWCFTWGSKWSFFFGWLLGAEEILAELLQVSQGLPLLRRASWSFKGQDLPSSSVP